MSNFSTVAPPNNRCECYKKLQYLGVPLSESGEDEIYGEELEEIQYEKSFDLPGVLTINPQVTAYPTVGRQNLPDIFYQMAQVIPNLSDFEVNTLSFWIMDVFVEGLWTAQKAGMHHEHQRATLLWIAYFFNYIQKNNPSRKELFRHLKKILFIPDYKMTEYPGEDLHEDFSRDSISHLRERLEAPNPAPNVIWELPIPPGMMYGNIDSDSNATELYMQHGDVLNKDYKEYDPKKWRDIWHCSNVVRFSVCLQQYQIVVSDEEEEAKSTTTKGIEDILSERNVCHMNIILEILYRIFARLWVYLEMQAVFRTMHSAEQVKLPFNLGIPKPAPKIDPFVPQPTESIAKTSTYSVPISDEIETEKHLHKNDYILPLQASDEAKTYIKQAFSHTISDPSISSKAKDRKKQG